MRIQFRRETDTSAEQRPTAYCPRVTQGDRQPRPREAPEIVTSHENVAIVRAGFDAFVAGDTDRALENLAPDVVIFRVSPLPDTAEYHGHAGFLKILADWTTGFSEFVMEGQQFTEAGGRVIVRVQQRATGASSGAAVEALFWFVHTLRDGKLAEVAIFGSEAQALEACRIRPE
ncbi:MAG: nuclear transport factor 2 family protein [Solirubrobacterales bacterium]